MNHMTLTVAAIVAAIALTGLALAIPQQVLAHYGHHHHHNNNNKNTIKVDQNITQENFCTQALCDNQANNVASIRH